MPNNNVNEKSETSPLSSALILDDILSRKSFDGRGNYTMGIKEQIIFPEIDYEKIDSIRGLDISITTSAKNDDEARMLLEEFNFPFRR